MLDFLPLNLNDLPSPAATPSYGAADPADAVGQVLGGLLGVAASETAVAVLRHPVVQAKIRDIQEQCQSRAKLGVVEVVKEYWWVGALGAGALLFGNYMMLTLGVIPLVRPRAAKAPKAAV